MVKRFCWRKRTEVGNLSILILSFSSVVSSNLPDVWGVASESQSEELLKCINMQMKWDIEYIVIIIMPIYVCVCTQLCLTLWDPVGYSSEGSSVHGVIPRRILEWVAMSPSKGSSWTQGSNPHLLSLLHWQQTIYHWATTSEAKCHKQSFICCNYLYMERWN